MYGRMAGLSMRGAPKSAAAIAALSPRIGKNARKAFQLTAKPVAIDPVGGHYGLHDGIGQHFRNRRVSAIPIDAVPATWRFC